MSQLALFATRWHGAFVASLPGAPCHLCGRRIKAGERVFYADHCLDDEWRTCAECREASA